MYIYEHRFFFGNHFYIYMQKPKDEPAIFEGGCFSHIICLYLTPNACALMGNVVLQTSTKGCLSSPAANTPIIHQEERLAVVVQAAGVAWCVLDVVPSRETPLQTDNTNREFILSGNCSASRVVGGGVLQHFFSRDDAPFTLPSTSLCSLCAVTDTSSL